MNRDSLAEALRALATSDTNRSETARLRDVIDEVEIAMLAGVSRTAVLKALHEQGFTMTSKSFESALYRLRKRRKTVDDGPTGIHRPVARTQSTAHKAIPASALVSPTSSVPQADHVPAAGKTLIEQVMSNEPKPFSFKQQQKEKSQP